MTDRVQTALFGPPDPFDPSAWFGCSCKPVWMALVVGELRDWIRARKACG